MKVLWHSVGPWVGSGYGQQTATFAPRLAALGHDLALSVYYGLQGAQLRWNGLKCYPAYETGYGNDVIVTHALDHFDVKGKAFAEAAASGLIISLCDVWVLSAPLLPDMSVAAWCPVDHVTLPGPTRRWFQTSGAAPIAMSRFGAEALAGGGLNPLYVPHGIDTGVFRPGDRAEARERTGLPADAFVVAMVAANVGRDGSRKAFAEQITAFAELRRQHSDALLVLHTDIANRQGIDIRRLLQHLPESSYIYSDQYAYRRGIPAEVVADIYRSADLLTNCSWGEGFGIPIVEAQACGTPVVVTDATAMSELCGAGWKVGYEPLWHESQESWASLPRIGEIAAAYLDAYDKAAGLRDEAAAFGMTYDADYVTDVYWVPALDQLEQGLARKLDEARQPKAHAAGARLREADGLIWVDRGEGTEDVLGPARHERFLEPLFTDLLPAGGVMVDVGAHVGHWTVRLAERAGRIIAIEPNPDAASVLRRNLAVNDIRNVDVIEVAAWDSETVLRLEDPNATETAGGSTRTLPVDNDEGDVRAERLEDLAIFHPDVEGSMERLDLVKLDVEGADLHALRGMRGLLARFRPALLIECHDYAGYYTRAELEETLDDLGYTWRVAASVKSRWSPNGTLAEPVDADYLVATPAPSGAVARIARTAVTEHGAAQQVDELAYALRIIDDLEPDVLVELGCDRGGTLYAWRQVCIDVYGITLADNGYLTGGTGEPLVDHGATVHIGDSHDLATLAWLHGQLGERPIDVLVLDGDHSVDGIRRDLVDYGPLVRPGGLILLHDIASLGDPRAEVHMVWPFLAKLYDTEEIRSPVRPFGWGIIHVGPDGFDLDKADVAVATSTEEEATAP